MKATQPRCVCMRLWDGSAFPKCRSGSPPNSAPRGVSGSVRTAERGAGRRPPTTGSMRLPCRASRRVPPLLRGGRLADSRLVPPPWPVPRPRRCRLSGSGVPESGRTSSGGGSAWFPVPAKGAVSCGISKGRIDRDSEINRGYDEPGIHLTGYIDTQISPMVFTGTSKAKGTRSLATRRRLCSHTIPRIGTIARALNGAVGAVCLAADSPWAKARSK